MSPCQSRRVCFLACSSFMSFLDVLFGPLNYKRTKNLSNEERNRSNVTSKVALVPHPKGFKMFKI